MRKILFVLLVTVTTLTTCFSKPIKVACIGDSITYGAGIEDREKTYPSALQRLMGDGYEVRNYGFSARVMQNDGDYPYMKETMYQEVKEWLPDIIVIMLGTNDSKPQNWQDIDRFKRDYLTMVDELRTLPSQPRIFLCLAPWASVTRWGINDSTIVTSINPAIESMRARRWLDVIDTHSPFVGNPELLFADGIHPNPAGAEVIAETVFNNLEKCGATGHQGKRVVFIGDSITDGDWAKADGKRSEDRNHYDMNHIYGHGYMSMCATSLLAKHPEKRYSFCNRGVSGDTLAGLESRWEKDVLALHPDIISILVGVNDSRKHSFDEFDFEGWEKRYRRILDQSQKGNPDVKFVLCTPFLEKVGAVSFSDSFPQQKKTVERMASIIRRIARDYNAVLVPFDEEMSRLVRTDRSGDIHYWTWDGVHPTYQAHQFLSSLWLKKTHKLF